MLDSFQEHIVRPLSRFDIRRIGCDRSLQNIRQCPFVALRSMTQGSTKHDASERSEASHAPAFAKASARPPQLSRRRKRPGLRQGFGEVSP